MGLSAGPVWKCQHILTHYVEEKKGSGEITIKINRFSSLLLPLALVMT
jgi:hypothetical protein